MGHQMVTRLLIVSWINRNFFPLLSFLQFWMQFQTKCQMIKLYVSFWCILIVTLANDASLDVNHTIIYHTLMLGKVNRRLASTSASDSSDFKMISNQIPQDQIIRVDVTSAPSSSSASSTHSTTHANSFSTAASSSHPFLSGFPEGVPPFWSCRICKFVFSSEVGKIWFHILFFKRRHQLIWWSYVDFNPSFTHLLFCHFCFSRMMGDDDDDPDALYANLRIHLHVSSAAWCITAITWIILMTLVAKVKWEWRLKSSVWL